MACTLWYEREVVGSKIVIAGSRSITDYAALEHAIAKSYFSIGEVVCGTARGVYTLGELWAAEHNVPVRKLPETVCLQAVGALKYM